MSLILHLSLQKNIEKITQYKASISSFCPSSRALGLTRVLSARRVMHRVDMQTLRRPLFLLERVTPFL